MYLLCFYVPIDHADNVKEKIFEAGAGKFNHYDQCCWQTPGQGQFRPLKNNQAYIGETNILETLEEYKVEIIVPADLIKSVVSVLKFAHPYEEPAYQVIKLENI